MMQIRNKNYGGKATLIPLVLFLHAPRAIAVIVNFDSNQHNPNSNIRMNKAWSAASSTESVNIEGFMPLM